MHSQRFLTNTQDYDLSLFGWKGRLQRSNGPQAHWKTPRGIGASRHNERAQIDNIALMSAAATKALCSQTFIESTDDRTWTPDLKFQYGFAKIAMVVVNTRSQVIG